MPKARSRNRSSVFLPWVVAAFALVPGCRNNDVLEMALRSREEDVYGLKAQNENLRAQNEALHHQLATLQGSGIPQPHVVGSPEPTMRTIPLRRIVVGSLTSGINEDGEPGDEALKVVIEPRDSQNHLVQVPGSVEINALEILSTGVKTPIGNWQLTPAQLRKTWRRGVFSTGYTVFLPWKKVPRSEQIRVVVRMSLDDGRVFEADRDIRVRPTATPSPNPGKNTLPMPRPLPPQPREDNPPAEPQGTLTPPMARHNTNYRPRSNLINAVKLHRPTPE
ncbi:MAG: hypothetical protein ACFCD0_17655 [Gemmataceae bacterium]